VVEDRYLWLEKLNDPKVLKWIRRENERTRSLLGSLPDKYYEALKSFCEYPVVKLARITERGYFVQLLENVSQKIVWLHGGEKRIVVEGSRLERDSVLTYFYVNKEGSRLAYSYSIAGSDEQIIRVIDLDSIEVVDEIKGAVGNLVWVDEDRFYYVKMFRREKTPDGVNPPASRVFLREDGSDTMVFGEGLPRSHFIYLHETSARDRILVRVSYGWAKSTLYGGRLSDPFTWTRVYGGDFVVKPVDYFDGYLAVSYDGDGLGKLIRVREDGSVESIVSESEYPLMYAVIVGDRILACYLANASSVFRLFKTSGEPLNVIEFYPPGSVYSMHSNRREAVFVYTSFTVPFRLYSFSDTLRIIDEAVFSGDYVIDEGVVESYDGTRVHFFTFSKKKHSKVALVYGYGGFGKSLTPKFKPQIMPFIQKGGVYVVVNTRGGREYGEKWHREGMREKKQNVFEDFKAVLKFFKEKGYRVAAIGVSNGGLLVAAVLTQSPELLDAALIGYPVIDMLRFHKLYIGRAWIPEYGDPDDPKDAEYLLKYSPYHNVRKTKYPPVLIFTGLHDDRVHPSHALKFVAKLKEIEAPVYLRVETRSGHSGAAPEIKRREAADLLAFLEKTLFK